MTKKQYNIKKSAILQIDIDNLLAGLVEQELNNFKEPYYNMICSEALIFFDQN